MIPNDFDTAHAEVVKLVQTFEKGFAHYKRPEYSESQVRKDFIDKLFIALGWDVNHEVQRNPYQQEVKVEPSVNVAERVKKADYSFALAPNFRDVHFFVEAKKPSVDIGAADNCFQIIRYAYSSSRAALSIITDFEQLHVMDCRFRPDIATAQNQIHLKFHYTEFADAEKFAKLYFLFGREAVENGSLVEYAKTLPKPKGRIVQRKLFTDSYQEVDESFLQMLERFREDLAKMFKRRNLYLTSEDLTEAVQRTIDRLVFIRFLEDKLIEPETVLDKFSSSRGAWQQFIAKSREFDKSYNGIIFKEHPIIDSQTFDVDDQVFLSICDELASDRSPYHFNYIPIHILGSIYERFLGNVIVATDKRATVEAKPEVRKAGGVYYTPQYIVNYIVENTVGELIKGKTPADVATMTFADIACGSGSFLLGVYDYLLQWHSEYYNRKAKRKEARAAGCVEHDDGTFHLSFEQKKEILVNNIYGVDIDRQAHEVTQLSLYLKLLEEETLATKRGLWDATRKAMLPSLTLNIVCGNSLVDWDITNGDLFEQLDPEKERKLNPMSFEQKFPAITRNGGFDAIVGNPPYVFGRDWAGLGIGDEQKNYFRNKFTISPYQLDFFSLFMDQAMRLVRTGGRVGQIVPNVWLTNDFSSITRAFILSNSHELILTAPPSNVFEGITVDTVIYSLVRDTKPGKTFQVRRITPTSLTQVAVNVVEDYVDGIQPISTSVGSEVTKILAKLKLNESTLGELAEITRGVHSYRTDGFGKSAFRDGPQTQRDRDERPYHSLVKNKKNRPFIYGKDLRRFEPPVETEYIEYGDWLAEPRRADFFQGERVYSRKILGERGLIVTVDENNTVADQQVYITKPTNPEYPAKLLAGILGSRVIGFFVRNYYDEDGDAFPQIKVGQLRSLPMPQLATAEGRYASIISAVAQILEAKPKANAATSERDRDFWINKCEMLERTIDAAVYKLYDLTPEEIRIIENS